MRRFQSLLLVCVLAAGSAVAHQPWVLTEPADVELGRAAPVSVYFGHAFPSDALIDPERISGVALVTPSGRVDTPDVAAGVPFQSPVLADAGTWTIGIEQARGYWSRTPDGGRPLPRSALDEVVTCNYSGNAAKTLVRVGDDPASSAAVPIGHRLEILPASDPTRMAAGDVLGVEVRFDGRAHSGPLLAFHAASGDEPYRTVETDDGGRAEIELVGDGPWMLVARAELPYPDPDVCDTEGFYASLTFHGQR